jgi:hypothetical protein
MSIDGQTPVTVTMRVGPARQCWLERAGPHVSIWVCRAGDSATRVSIPQRFYERSDREEYDGLKGALRIALEGRTICTVCHGVGETVDGGPRMRRTSGCEHCKGSGWEPVEYGTLPHGTFAIG